MTNKMTKQQNDLQKDDLEIQQKQIYWENLLSKYPTFDNAYDYVTDLFSYTDENGIVRERPQGGGMDTKIIRKYMLEKICNQYNIGK